MIEGILLLLAGAVLGYLTAWLLTPWFARPQRRMERSARRITGVRPIDFHVEQDPAAIHAGEPDWIAFAAWVPTSSSLPTHAPKMSRGIVAVATQLGGGAAVWQHIRIRITAEMSCILEDLEIVSRKLDPLKDAVILRCPVGGADLEPRRILVEFSDSGTTIAKWREGGMDQDLPRLRFKLVPGEIEELLLDATGAGTDYAWALQLTAVADGRKQMVRVPREGDFIFRSGSGLPSQVGHAGTEWETC